VIIASYPASFGSVLHDGLKDTSGRSTPNSPCPPLSDIFNMVQGLRLGSIAPDFEAETTAGTIKFHEWLNNSWAVIFSHPGERYWMPLPHVQSYAFRGDFTPVCTTELGEVARRAPEFQKRGVK
jgi:hypothetical protein